MGRKQISSGSRAHILSLAAAKSGQSLVELAVTIPIFILLLAYAVDFGYFYIATAAITCAARNATQYASSGYEAIGQETLPGSSSVATEAIADLAGLAFASTTTTVEVCSKAIGVSGNVAQCNTSGPAAPSYTPAADPEAPTFVLQRVDVTYTVRPPIPLSFFTVPLLPSMQFHRQVSMRAMD